MGYRYGAGRRRSFATALRAGLAGALLTVLAGCGGGDDTPTPAGESVYQRFCFACHAAGAAGAPRVGRPEDWQDRMAAGRPVMLQHVIEGMPGMPPRGGCVRCTDEELQAAVDYMLERSR